MSPEELRKKGFSDQFILQQTGVDLAQPKTSGRGGFLSSLISEGGAAGGAAVGSAILPGIGTIAGATIGGLLGRLSENKIRDDEFKVGSALGEGVFSGATAGLAPLFRGAKAAKAASGVGDDALKAFAGGFSSPSGGALARSLASKSDDLAVKGTRLSPSQLKNFKQSTGIDVADLLKKEKLVGKSPEQVDELISGLSQEFGANLDSITKVSKKTLQANLKKTYEPLLKSANLQEQKIGQAIQEQADNIIKNFDQYSNGRSLFDLGKTFDAGTNWKAALADPDRANLNQKIGSAIRETLRGSGDNNLKSIGQRLNKLHTFNNSLQQQVQLGRGSQMFGLTDLMAAGGGGTVGGPVGAAGAIVGKRLLNSPKTASALSGGAGKLAGVLDSTVGKGVTGFSSQLAGQLGARVPGAIAQSSPNTSPMANPMSTQNMSVNMGGILPQAQATQQPDISNQIEILRSETLLDAIQQGASQADLEQVNMAFELALQSAGYSSPSAMAQETDLTEAETSRRDLVAGIDALENVIAGGSINMGPVGSRVEGIKSIFNAGDPETVAFRAATSAVKAAIAKARAGTSFTDGEKQLLEAYAPNDTDSMQQFQTKLALLKQLFASDIERFGGGSNLTSALGAL